MRNFDFKTETIDDIRSKILKRKRSLPIIEVNDEVDKKIDAYFAQKPLKTRKILRRDDV